MKPGFGTDEERTAFRETKLTEALQALIDGKHTYGCHGYLGEYGRCSCVLEIARSTLAGDITDLHEDEDGVPLSQRLPVKRREMAHVLPIAELGSFDCRRCGARIEWGVVDLVRGRTVVRCRCGMWHRVLQADVLIAWCEEGFEEEGDAAPLPATDGQAPS